jgi:hypothetical protein
MYICSNLCDKILRLFKRRKNMTRDVKMRENPLGYEKISTLLRKFAVPSIISMLVSSLYNIVDQVFIGQGVGTIGNGATNVAFPFTTICLALSLTIGVGGAARFSLELGRGNKKEASYSIGVATTVGALAGMLLLICFEAFACRTGAYRARSIFPFSQEALRGFPPRLSFLWTGRLSYRRAVRSRACARR